MAELLDHFAKDRREIFANDRNAGIWALRHLWTANARYKCRTLLAETVFIKPTGDIDRWLLSSSKSGDVIKKRAATVEMLLSRFGRAWSAQETTCIAYLRNGKTKRVLLSDLGAAFDLCTAQAVQTYIPPSGNRVRNLYVCEWRSTGKGPTAGAVEAQSRPVSWDTTTGDQVLGPATKCRALSLRKLLHESTESLATYLQHEMNVVVHSITAHFVMDPEERPWLTWFEAARLEDVSMAAYADPTNATTEEKEQPVLEIDASLSRNLSLNLDSRIKTPNTVASPNASRVRKRPRGGRRRSDERARFGSPRATATDAVALGIQVGHATAHVEDHDASEDVGNLGASGETDVEKTESAASLRAREARNFTIAGTSAAALDATGAIKINAPPVVDQHYPNPFNCRGDFCDFPVQEPPTLYSKAPETVSKRSGQVGLALAKRLFSKNELEAMAMKMGFNMATPQGHEDALEALGKRLEATGPGPDVTKRIQHYAKPQYEHYQLPMKSIAMARKEKRGFVASMGVQGGANPSSQKRAPGADTFARPKDRGIEGLDAREHLLEQHGGVPLSHFYEHVTVCPNCYRIYSTLDQARDILEGEAMRRSRREAALRGGARDAAREDLIARLNAKGQQRRALDGREPAARERTRTPSPIRSARRYVQELPELLPNRSTPDLPTRAELREEEDRKAVELAQNLTNAVVKAVEGGACTREEAKRLQAEHESLQKFEDLESYLRGTRERKYNEVASALIAHEANPRSRRAPKSNKAGKRGGHLSLADREKEKERDARRYKGQVLLAEEDDDIREQVSSILRDAEYTVTVFSDGPPALEMCRDNYFDLFLTSTLLPSLNGLEVAKLLRKREKKGDPDKQTLPLVALAAETAPEDLRLYMDAGFDGCVSKPVDEVSLLNTVRAAIPRHEPSKSAAKRLARKLGPGGSSTTATSGSTDFEVPLTRPTTSGLMTSSDVVKLTLPMPRNNLDEEASSTGVFQMDADTSFPYLVMGEKRSGSRLFNIVVLHDFFDTYETMQIFFRPIVTKYPGLQVLVFNLPGQAFTEWRRDAILNNEYYDHCVDALLRHVDYNGTKELETRGPYAMPFYLMGFGNGANIAMQYAARCKPPKMRALLSLNGFSHVDPHLAGILHDCMNVFSCAPATRPDLPVYFYTRFLFSSAYLSKVSTPLALNLYTAVHNPITLEGRMQICKGSLAHADLRDEIKQLDKPIILVQSSQGGLVKPLHVEPIVKLRGGEARSIRQCLKDRSRPCVIWLRSGHELFQECRRPVSDLIEQLCTGYHENHDVAFLPTADDAEAQSPGRTRRQRDSGKRGGVGGATGQPSKFFEDRFIDNVLGTLDKVRQEGGVEANPFAPNSQQQQQLQQQQQQRPGSREAKQSLQSSVDQLNESDDPAENPRAELSRWQNFREETGRRAQGPSAAERNRAAQDAKASRRKDAAAVAAASAAAAADLSFDPTMRNFDWAQKRRKGTDPDSDDEGDFDPRFGGVPARAMKPVEVPEIREYMRWRIARNKKRLAKFVRSACVIQRAWRAFLARTLAEKLRTTRAALLIQSKWRAKLARDELEQRRQEEWAARLVQRCWRGKAGRDLFRERRAQVNAARHMQRIFRGRQGKKRVESIKQKRRRAAMAIQNMVRAHIARKLTWRLRQQRNAAIDIQRVYRGHRGRGRASLERDKYLFSKAQSQGIDFGRQMLLEHKLHGTRLQSEVSMLTREKVETEEKVEALLSEISEFDKGVRALEKEMHELSAVETEAKGVLDEEARIELREQKMRLDHEFGIMLGKIADRKERLKNLEVKLQTIDRTRQGKEEELRDLERKLVVLLEEQQQELEQIKRRQQTRGELALPETAATALQVGAGGGVGGGAALGGPMASPYAGPTPQQQQQANNMMQSTESLMKFGFMSMSLTYFSSLNMVRAMRKVGALNTVLHGPAGTGAGQAQIHALLSGANGSSAGGKAGDAGTGAGDSSESAESSGHFRPGFRKGQMPEEQDALTVTAWTVEDVGDWLGTLKLKQYRACFADAAIDGAFLYDLNDDDLRNTLGIEHNLHRKKILSSIVKLRRMEEAHSAQSMSNTSLSGSSLMSIQAVKNSAGGTTMNGSSGSGPAPGMPVVPSVDSMDDTDGRPISAAASLTVHPDKLLSMARHGKVREMREAMQALPDRPFDPSDVTEQYVDSYGTKYSDELGRLQWFINKADEHGNTLMTIAAQNGRIKVAKLLLDKGANVNHQNVQGQTPLHYAMAYNFYELGAWLTDAAEGASANDQLINMYGLTPYDGLSPE